MAMTIEKLREYVEFYEANNAPEELAIALHAIACHNTIDDLASLLRRIIHASKRGNDTTLLRRQVGEYLERRGLSGSNEILRTQ